MQYKCDFIPIQESLETIVNTLNDDFLSISITILVNEIGIASQEQTEAITQMTIGANQISDVVQMNSAKVKEIAASIEELTLQAQNIAEKMSVYKLKAQ